ncbi:MAG TPA: RNA polymerase sigma factor [Cyclobacteriaceae bacterium]|nr:RNA polymerase sigma factor [Cyclobacteriaceae bacterium]
MTEQEQRQVFEKWINQYKTLLFKVVRTYAFTSDDREDLFQEIAIQVWHSIKTFKADAAVTTWLYRIALNTSFKWVRKEHKHQKGIETLDNVEHILHENKQFMDDRLVWLYEEIYKLDEIDRSLTLLMLDGFSYKEMSDIIGITESNVGVKINRIKKHLILKSKIINHGV